MRAKSDIIAYLESQLSDDIWKKLRNSLLGRELLAFGAEVISENENVKDTMLLQMNPETADKNGLYMLSQMNETPITNIKPSTVVVQMADSVRTYAPYELQYNVGNVHFTNIEYTMQGKSVSLINGTHKCYAVGMNRSTDSVEGGSETFFYDGTTTYSGIKLGNAYPDSIVVTDEDGLEIPRYSSDIALSNNIDMMYKVVTGVDGNTFVRFLKGDDTIPNPTTYKIDWLDHSAMEFEVEDNDVKDGNDTVATIEYYSQGVVDDLDYMRQQLKKEMAKYNGLNTPVSVESYVCGLPYVLDAKCEKDADGVCVYIKPSSPTPDYSTYLDFSEIAAHISLNSILFPNIKVRTANQIMFGVEIGGVSDLKMQQNIKSLLQERFSYENMKFNTVINTGSILAEIYGKYGVVPTINMTIKEDFVQNKPLSFTPIKNTLKLYDVNDSVVAWEENDLLYGRISSKSTIPFLEFNVVGSMGTMFLLMYEGNRDDSATHYTKNGLNLSDNSDYNSYESDITYPKTGYNKFYLYDASTNTIKPFDGCMQNLLYSDGNPNLKYSAWNTDEQTFGNLYDFNILSTNNALVVQMVFNGSGVEAEQIPSVSPTSSKLFYWQNNNNASLYNKYLNGSFVENEWNNKYKGKYQTIFFVKNPLALRNYNADSWNIFQDNVYGDPETMLGMYDGLRNIDESGNELNIKSNWFIHNNKQYYVYKIGKNQVYITNGAKNLAVNINGTFLGMMPYNNDLYVINESYITRVIGFEGLKEKEEIYQICKDVNTPIVISQIIREFDNQIVFRTNIGEYYTATGFKILSGNGIGFTDLKQIFDDNDTIKNEVKGCKIGGCTKDYVTLYKKIESQSGTTLETGYKFYCYEVGVSKTSVYEKTMTAELPEPSDESVELSSYKVNLATFWDNDTNKQQAAGVRDYNYTGKLCYFVKQEGTTTTICSTINENNIFFSKNSAGNWRVYVDKVIIDGAECTVPLCIEHPNGSLEEIGSSGGNSSWEYTGGGTNDFDTDYLASFYKICYNIFKNNEITYKNDFNYKNPKSVDTTRDGDIETKTYKYETFYNRTVKYKNGDSYSESASRWYTTGVSDLIQSSASAGSNHLYTEDAKIVENGSDVFLNAIEGYTPTGQLKKKSGDSYVNDSYYQDAPKKKINMVFFTQKSTMTQTSGYNITDLTSEQELSTVGYYDTDNNSIVNDRGTNTSYIRYNTQNPNITSGSYLMLDESEIKFV